MTIVSTQDLFSAILSHLEANGVKVSPYIHNAAVSAANSVAQACKAPYPELEQPQRDSCVECGEKASGFDNEGTPFCQTHLTRWKLADCQP